ncbi:MAG: hypothetical protein J6L02_07325 [Bacteroidales bacterium]|nr:hypothetical protein [Bacteroidales bacterium]
MITTNDSIAVREIVRDSIITIPPDSAWLYAWLECDSVGNVLIRQLEQKEGERINTSYTLNQDTSGVATLRLLTTVDMLKKAIEVRDKEIDRLKTNAVLVEAKIPPFKQFLMWTGGISLIFVATYIFIKLYLTTKN